MENNVWTIIVSSNKNIKWINSKEDVTMWEYDIPYIILLDTHLVIWKGWTSLKPFIQASYYKNSK